MLALACAPNAIFAQAATREICVDPAGGSPGERITIPIVIFDGAGVAAFQVDARFASDSLTWVSTRLGPDTAAAGGWILDSQVLDAGLIRVLGYTFPPTGLTPGVRRVAMVDFDIVAPASIQDFPLPLSRCVLGDSNAVSIPCAACVQPGADAAAPRFALSEVDDGFAFRPSRIIVEQGDWVLWKHVGTTRSHTTTSGAGCVLNGIWRGVLSPGGRFARRFSEPGGSSLPYFSEPDCAFGMTGEIEVTDVIRLDLSPDPGGTLLTWAGGGGRYLVHRSDARSFVGPPTTAFTPDGGAAGTSFLDDAQAQAGQALFYLVTNSP